MQDTIKHHLGEYVELPELLPTVQQTFPTEDSLKWFVRRHRQTLVDSGSMIIVSGRMRFHPELFQGAVVEIGRRAAGKPAGGAQ
jgi:hypothetical protein